MDVKIRLVAACLLLLGMAAGPGPVKLTIRPQIMLAKSDIHVEARVPSDADNRILAISWTSDDGSVGETIRQLDGENAPVLFDLWLRDQLPAHYAFIATVYGRNGKPRGQDIGTITTPDRP